jgi:hypothetical protein
MQASKDRTKKVTIADRQKNREQNKGRQIKKKVELEIEIEFGTA